MRARMLPTATATARLGLLPLLVSCAPTPPGRGGPAVDADGDGYAADVDCDDADPSVHPDAVEVCDPAGVDEDCNGVANDRDDGLSSGSASLFFADSDGDGFGDPARSGWACEQPAGFTTDASDCDDDDATASPEGREVCDPVGVDEDCDGQVNEADDSVDPSSLLRLFRDADGDGHGDPAVVVEACSAEAGVVVDGDDCDDTAPEVHPGATEVCDPDAVDEDCDGLSDDADASTDLGSGTEWFVDGDLDGFGDPSTGRWACLSPVDHVDDGSDCDDADPDVNPAAGEACNGEDDDCDGVVPANELDVDADGCSTCEGDTDDNDGTEVCENQSEVGGTALRFSVTSALYGNIYAVTSDAELASFAVGIEAPAGCVIDVRVHESTGRSGPWTLLWEDSVTSTGVSPVSAGSVDQTLLGGMFYALTAGWSCTAFVNYDSRPGASLPFGSTAGAVYDNQYTRSSYRLGTYSSSMEVHQLLTHD